MNAYMVVGLAFRELPLAEHGWTPVQTRAQRIKDNIWRIEKT